MTERPSHVAPTRSGGAQPFPEDASVGNLFSEVTANLSTLVRQEVALAKTEAKDSATQAAKGAGMLAGAAWAGHFLALFASVALWWWLATAMGERQDPALIPAALIVAAIWAVIALILALTGKAALKQMRGLPHTTDTVRQIPDALKGND